MKEGAWVLVSENAAAVDTPDTEALTAKGPAMLFAVNDGGRCNAVRIRGRRIHASGNKKTPLGPLDGVGKSNQDTGHGDNRYRPPL